MIFKSNYGLIMLAYVSLIGPTSAEEDNSLSHRFLRPGEGDHRSNPEVFPKVYTAIVPHPQNGEDEGSKFAAKVDLLELDCQLRDTSDTKNENEFFCRIAFLVHTEEELLHILRKREKLTLNYDLEMTNRFVGGISSHQGSKLDNLSIRQGISTISGYSCYSDLAGSFAVMQDLVLQGAAIPNLSVSLVDIGDSFLKSQDQNQGHDIWALEISGNGVQVGTNNKGVMMAMSGIHPREYAPPELLLRWAQEMISAYGNDPDVTAILDHTSIHLVIQANPDGRYLAETTQIYRRRNLNTNDGGFCSESSKGVDLNRNFPFRWGNPNGSSGDPCDETYRGTAPASEPETRAIVDYASSLFPEGQRKGDPVGQANDAYPEDAMGIFLDIHSYGEIIIWPWGNVNEETANNDGLEALVNKYRHFNGYGFSGPGNGFLYPCSGASDDWSFGTLGVAGMTFELGTEFHQDCSYFVDYIVPDNIPALTYAAKTATAPYSIPKGPDIISFSAQSAVSNTGGGTSISIEATASDSAYSSANFETSRQGIEEIRVYVDAHPYDLDEMGNPSPYTVMEGGDFGGTSGAAQGILVIEMNDGDPIGKSLEPGRHSVFLQARDTNGYYGPVTAFWLDVEPSPPGACEDSDELFVLTDHGRVSRSCSWLSLNMSKFQWLCDRINVATTCPLSCDACDMLR